MNQSDTAKLKLYARGQKIRNEQVVATQADNEKKMAPPIEKRIEYYEFPNGTIVKCIHSDGVYRFNTNNGEWEIDHSLTAEFAWAGLMANHVTIYVEKQTSSVIFPRFLMKVNLYLATQF